MKSSEQILLFLVIIFIFIFLMSAMFTIRSCESERIQTNYKEVIIKQKTLVEQCKLNCNENKESK